MALTLQNELQMAADVASFYIEDKTLAYSVSNIGGWGSPNVEIGDSCLMLFVERVTSDGNVVVPVLSTQFVTSLAVFDHTFQVSYPADGHYKIGMFAIPVTTDGITTLGGATIVTGDVVYYNGDVQKHNGATYDVVTDYTTLYDEAGVPQVVQERLLFANINLLYNQKYNEYALERNTNCRTNGQLEELLNEILYLGVEINGAYYAFWSGSPSEARLIIERLNVQYS